MGSQITRILLAVSESSTKGYPYPSISSKGAFGWIVEKIVRSNNSDFKLFFLHVQPYDDYCNVEERSKNRLRAVQLLQYFLIRCRDIGVQSAALNRQGNPKEVICRQVERIKPELLVVGSSRPSAGLCAYFRRLFVADVSGFCVKNAKCQVLTIIRGEADEVSEDEEATAANHEE